MPRPSIKERPWRQVVDSVVTVGGGWQMLLTLDCGHEVYRHRSGPRKIPRRVRCEFCERERDAGLTAP